MKYDMNRVFVSLGIGLLAISVAGFFAFQVWAQYAKMPISTTLIGIGIAFLVGLAFLMFAYLKGGQRLYAPKDFSASVSYDSGINKIKNIGNSLEDLLDRISSIEQKLTQTPAEKEVFTEKDREDLINTLKDKLSQNVTEDFLKTINLKYGQAMANESLIVELGKHCDRTESRLRNEIESLTRRGNINLIIGVLTTLIAIGILASTVIMNDLPSEPEKLAAHFLPRFTLSMFIEVFSFFFLRLYSTSLNDIKYFQNELTNIESRFIALRRATVSGDEKSLSMILDRLGETERNFVLKKGETTVDLEKSKIDQQSLKEMLIAFVDTVKPKKK